MANELDEESIIKASSQFWEQMLCMRLAPVAAEHSAHVSRGDVVGSVTLSGAWNGSIEIIMNAGLATTATAAMLMQAAAEVTEADKLDAAKEIANMIAGTIKSALPRPCHMTVPCSGLHPAECGAPCAPHGLLEVALAHDSGCLWIRVLRRAAE